MNRRISYLIVALVFIFCTFASAATIEGVASSLEPTELLLVAAPDDEETDDPSGTDDPQEGGDTDPPAPDITLSFTNPPDTMNVGDKTQISYALRDAPKNTKLNWASSNKNVATVDSEGNVVAVSPGKVEITASVPNSGIKTSTLIEVTEIEAKSVKITALEISGADLLLGKHSLKVGDIVHLDFDVDPKDAVKGEPKWSSSDQTIVTVDNKGVVKAIAEGDATVTLKVGDLSDEIAFTVGKEQVGINLWIIICAALLLIAIIIIIVVAVKRKNLKKELEQKEEEEAERQRIDNAVLRDRTMRQPIDNREVPYRDIFDEQSADRTTKVFTPVAEPNAPLTQEDVNNASDVLNENNKDIDDIIDVNEETDYLKDDKAPEKDEAFSLEDIDDFKY